jgi:hypothetical protein
MQRVCQPFFAFSLKKVVLHRRERVFTESRLKVNLFFHFFSLFLVRADSTKLAKANQADIGPGFGSRRGAGRRGENEFMLCKRCADNDLQLNGFGCGRRILFLRALCVSARAFLFLLLDKARQKPPVAPERLGPDGSVQY